MILRFRPCWAYPIGWSNCWVYPVGWSIYGGRVEVEEGQEGSIETIEVVGPRCPTSDDPVRQLTKWGKEVSK